MKKLYYLQIQNNKITSLPDEICNCDSLKTISAYNNLISYIPENIGNIPEFHAIFLNTNRLKHVPNSLIPFGVDDVDLCFNDSLVFTPEQEAWGVKDYQDYFWKYCPTDISDENFDKKPLIPAPVQINGQAVVLHLTRNSHVCCVVYDLLGKLVETLINKAMSAGSHTIAWDRARYSPGVYILRLTQETGISSSKTVVGK